MKTCIFLISLALCAVASTAAQATESMTLDQTLAAAYMKNPALQAAQARLRATDEDIARAKSGWRPSIDATAEQGTTWERVDPAPSESYNPFSVGLTITQPIFRGFRTVSSTQSAEEQVQAGRASLAAEEQDILLDTINAYLGVIEAREILETVDTNEQILQKELQDTRNRMALGDLKKTDVSQAETRLRVATVRRLEAQNALNDRRNAFMRLTGMPPGNLQKPALPRTLPASEQDAVTQAQMQNPAIIEASYNTSAAKSNIETVKGSLLPEINLIGSALHGRQLSSDALADQNSLAILARVTVPLYRSGADHARVRAAQQTAAEHARTYQDIFEKTGERAADAYHAFKTANAAKTGRMDAVSAAEEALEGVRVESQLGTRTTIDVLNAEQELLDARTSLATAEKEEIYNAYKVLFATGNLTAAALQLPVDIYSPAKHYDAVKNKWAGLSE